MTIDRILWELKRRRAALEEAIRALEGLSGRVRGRASSPPVPGARPKWLGARRSKSRAGRPVGRPPIRHELLPAPEPLPAGKRRRKRFSGVTIARMRAAQKARWQKIRAGQMVNPFQKQAARTKAAGPAA